MKMHSLIFFTMFILASSAFAQEVAPKTKNKADKLIKLHEMMESDFISQDQFNELKNDLLSNDLDVQVRSKGLSRIEKAHPLKISVPELGINLIRVEAGKFIMESNKRSNKRRRNESPAREVNIEDAYWMTETEVTNCQYKKIMTKIPTSKSKSRRWTDDDVPVIDVSWHDSTYLCRKHTKIEDEAGRLPKEYEYRLPTEAEWEYAAKGGLKSKNYTYSGSNNINEVAWYRGNSEKRTKPVAQKKPNELGLYDMSGNVWEWCYDWYGGRHKVNRGGSWFEKGPEEHTVTSRDGWWIEGSSASTGFRICLGPVIKKD